MRASNKSRSDTGLVWIPSLSVQQLLDCDTVVNKGCGGGNPLLAYQYIARTGLVPWTAYPYEEKSDAAQCSSSSMAMLREENKYFVEDFNKVASLDPTAIMRQLIKGPVAIGICGTERSFLYYRSGLFDLGSCCKTQNHAVVLVGFGHDEQTGQDYWIAQNSWSSKWGEDGFIRLLRTDTRGDSGICGMLLNPMACSGGYVLDGRGRYVMPPRYPPLPVYLINLMHWLQDNAQDLSLYIAAGCVFTVVLFLLYAAVLDKCNFCFGPEVRATRQGYQPIHDR